MRNILAGLLLFLGLASPALAQQVQNPLPNAGNYGAYNSSPPTCITGTGCWLQTDINGNLKVTAVSSSSSPQYVKSGSYTSAGTDQFALAIGTNTQLTVPVGTICAQITVETASIRRTSDTTSATTTNGTLIQVGAQWQDCGPLAAYKFTAVSGSPTLDVEYFK